MREEVCGEGGVESDDRIAPRMREYAYGLGSGEQGRVGREQKGSCNMSVVWGMLWGGVGGGR